MFKDETLGTIWVGEVINTSDPLQLGRVKVRVFGKYDNLDEEVIPWAIPYNQLASGVVIIPKIGEFSNVFFENGDENIPFYTGIAKTNNDLLGEFGDDYPNVWSIVYDKTLGQDRTLEIFYTETQGLIIRKNNSFIQIKNEDDSILLTNGKTNKSIHISEDGISLGSEGTSAEPAVLGDTLETLLNDFITELGKIGAIPTPAGPSGTLSSSPLWAPLVAKFKKDWETMKSELISLDKDK
tara:strand:+ start:687 stop:1403 length:717 start_codon:yes stop_codon:yes gene_type:complete